MHLEQERSQRATAYLEQVTESDELRGLSVTRHVLRDNPASAILAVAQQHHATLIVLCSHGETGLKRWVLGSVALKVARQSPVPVLILRPEAVGATASLLTPSRSIRVLVPLDGSLMAEEALAPAIALTRALSAPRPGALHLVSVLPFYQMEENVQLVQAVQDYLASTERHIREREGGADLVLTSSLLLHIDVASALLDLAETGKGMEHIEGAAGCDVIAMATYGRGSAQNWMLGSITERVLTATKLPLLMVRPR
ncbi:MAG TPA: universal stress protein, partial [Ktedonobacteraceae bacterium]|nr:universal stress protein [Ktedonobacteraceae bacterium]